MHPHHDGSAFHVSDLAPKLGDRVTVWLRAPEDVRGVFVRYTLDGEPAYAEATLDRARTATCPGERWWRAGVPMRNPVMHYRFLLSGPTGASWFNALGLADHDVPDSYDFRLIAHDPPPGWARDAIIYQIFPDRFARSAAGAGRPVPDWAIACDWDSTPVCGSGPSTVNQFYGGDLDGIVERLDHIGSLGATAVYLTPIFPAPSNHRYNAASFDMIDSLLGGEAALGRLSEALTARGMRLIGDLTTNHCGSTHPWLGEAIAAGDGSPERGVFYFDAEGTCESWLGHRTLPKLNWNSPLLRSRFLDGPDSIVARWLRYFSAWRVDVANMTGRRESDDLTREIARLVRRAAVTARPDALVIAEHNHDASPDLDAGGWHGTMNYAGFTRPVWAWLRCEDLDLPDFLGVPGPVPHRTGAQAATTMRAFGGLVSWQTLTTSWNIISSHDTARIRTVVGEADRVELAVGLMMTYPGTPMLFAGDELGLTGVNGEDSRTPMPWTRTGTWDQRTLGDVRRLVALRNAHPALRSGGLRWVYAGDDVLAFLRESQEETLLVCARRAAGEPVALAGLTLPGRQADNLHGGAALTAASGAVLLPGDGPTFQVWRL